LLLPSKWASLDVYTDATAKAIAEAWTAAEMLCVDSSDLMLVAVGSGWFWSGTLDYVSGEALGTILANIEVNAGGVHQVADDRLLMLRQLV
jgi:hypothetical protein